MDINIIKALHIIFMVSWFAGLFYIVRLFIYHTEAEQLPKPDKGILQKQYKLMAKRLWYIITWPAAILTAVFGFWLVYELNYWTQPWMQLKFGFLALLYTYHFVNHSIFKNLQKDIIKWSSFKLRLWNEGATLLLFAIVFIVTVGKYSLDKWYYGMVGIAILGGLFFIIAKAYKKKRTKKG